jgi:hypothetical protein
MAPQQLARFKRNHTITNYSRYQIATGETVAKMTFFYRKSKTRQEKTYRIAWLGCKYLSLKTFLDEKNLTA